LEADDALASAARIAAGQEGVEKVCIWTPDKDLAQRVRDLKPSTENFPRHKENLPQISRTPRRVALFSREFSGLETKYRELPATQGELAANKQNASQSQLVLPRVLGT
jgi:5'-3' exonuclease